MITQNKELEKGNQTNLHLQQFDFIGKYYLQGLYLSLPHTVVLQIADAKPTLV